MNAEQNSDVIMNEDSDLSDFNEDIDIEYDDSLMDVDEPDSNEEDSDNDVAANTPTTSRQPGPSHLRDLRRSCVWQSVIQQPQLYSFSGTQGPTSKVEVNDMECPYEFFKLFFTDNLLNFLVRETNRYASQYLTKTKLSPKCRAKNWSPVTIEEMEVFLGLVSLTGLIDKKGWLASYWTRNLVLQTPFFGQCMPRDRLQLITTFLHFNNNEVMASDCTEKFIKLGQCMRCLQSNGARCTHLENISLLTRVC